MARLGAIADDVTGAVDLASSLVERGFRTRLIVGVPPSTPSADGDALVVALKSRTAPVDEASRDVSASLDMVQAAGAEQIYLKYCSTFDSTPEGNIGPVGDLLADRLSAARCVVVPSFPANGRTVYAGHLFVGTTLLSESSMAHHPLTPMRDSNVVRLLQAQTRSRVGLITQPHVRRGAQHLRTELDRRGAAGERFIVVDATDDDDLRTIAAATADDALITGGSGLALGMVGPHPGQARATAPAPTRSGPGLVLVGSASATTRRQMEAARAAGLSCLTVDPTREGADIEALVRQARDAWGERPDVPVMIAPERIDDEDRRLRYASQLERTLASLARYALGDGVRRILVAGGETSGAVLSELEVTELHVGAALGPGLAWTYTDVPTPGGREPVALALKSGNFGSDTLFIDAWEALV